MPGAAYLLDLTRLTSRFGRGALTGIDRVELAYLQHFNGLDCALFGVVRTGLGYFLLDKQGCNQVMAYALGTERLPPMPIWAKPWAKPQLRGALALRPACAMRARPWRLSSLLGAVPKGAVYLNVGHSNLTESMILAVKSAGMRAAVLIHDTIPLDLPQFARKDSIAPFRAKLSATARLADLVIHTSQDARHKTEVHFANFGRLPPGVTAHLGVTLAPPPPPLCTPPAPILWPLAR